VILVDYDRARVKGSADAPMTIVELRIFSAPSVAGATPVNDVLVKYKGKVKLAYRDFPLSQIHQHADWAAEASRCALTQGKYWECTMPCSPTSRSWMKLPWSRLLPA